MMRGDIAGHQSASHAARQIVLYAVAGTGRSYSESRCCDLMASSGIDLIGKLPRPQ